MRHRIISINNATHEVVLELDNGDKVSFIVPIEHCTSHAAKDAFIKKTGDEYVPKVIPIAIPKKSWAPSKTQIIFGIQSLAIVGLLILLRIR